ASAAQPGEHPRPSLPACASSIPVSRNICFAPGSTTNDISVSSPGVRLALADNASIDKMMTCASTSTARRASAPRPLSDDPAQQLQAKLCLDVPYQSPRHNLTVRYFRLA